MDPTGDRRQWPTDSASVTAPDDSAMDDGQLPVSARTAESKTDPQALANLYPEAAEYASAHWAGGLLETRSKAIHSSQALCVSVLLTLRQRPPDQRTSLMAAIAEQAGLALPVASSPIDID